MLSSPRASVPSGVLSDILLIRLTLFRWWKWWAEPKRRPKRSRRPWRLFVDWEKANSSVQGASRSCRQPAAGGAQQGSALPHSARRTERGRRRRGSELRAWASMGRDGTKPSVVPRRRAGRDSPFYGTHHGSDGDLDEGSRHPLTLRRS